MLEKIVIFILFLGPLVFFHELGHYLFARLFGVRVEVFSIGFGPKILKFKRGFTEYAISLIPLGGYVKMFGDDPLKKDEIPVSERAASFTYKGKLARFWIVFGGPLANFIMAYFIFFALLLFGEKAPAIKWGLITKDSITHQIGLRTGDILKAVNGIKINGPTDFPLEGEDSLVESFTVSRKSQEIKIVSKMTAKSFFETLKNHPPYLRSPLVINNKGEVFAVSTVKDKVLWNNTLDEMSQGGLSGAAYLFPLFKDWSSEDSKFTKSKILPATMKVIQVGDGPFIKNLLQAGYRPLDLTVNKVNANSPALKAGFKQRDVIISLNGNEISAFEELRLSLQKIKTPTIKVGVWRDGETKYFDLVPDVQLRDGKEVKLIGVYSAGEFIGPELINTASKGLLGSFTHAFVRTYDNSVKVFSGFKSLITGAVSFKNVGGPFSIGKVATDSFNTSLSYFFQLMALISINLGIINLLPIPVLDGGHILFIILEILNGGPVSRRKMEIAQQVGLSLLLMLMIGAIFNDYTRFF